MWSKKHNVVAVRMSNEAIQERYTCIVKEADKTAAILRL